MDDFKVLEHKIDGSESPTKASRIDPKLTMKNKMGRFPTTISVGENKETLTFHKTTTLKKENDFRFQKQETKRLASLSPEERKAQGADANKTKLQQIISVDNSIQTSEGLKSSFEKDAVDVARSGSQAARRASEAGTLQDSIIQSIDLKKPVH